MSSNVCALLMFINLSSLFFRFLENSSLVLGVSQKGKWDQKDLQL
jgi:hypothetical protein